ncbi:MAG: hypothetical protein ACRC2O_13770 [Chitinophagaceae bacterium]
MKIFIDKFRNTILSGIMLFLPLFFLIGLIQKLWYSLTGVGAKIAGLVQFKVVTGVGAASIITSILIILIFYISGLLVRFAFIGKFKNWIEDSFLQYIPGYLTYKVKVETKLIKKTEDWLPVLVKSDEGARPALLIEVKDQMSTVFFPNSPDTNYGVIWVVDSVRVKHLSGDANTLLKSVQYSGKGLLEMQL